MRFWFRVFSPHQSRWRTYAATEKRKLIHDHAATVFEDVCRARFPGAQRYWESNVELDLVAPDPDDAKRLLVAELKWRRLTVAERKNVLRQLETKWSRWSLGARYPQRSASTSSTPASWVPNCGRIEYPRKGDRLD